MKTIAFILALLINASLFAQASSPTYVKVSSNKVKVTWFHENGQVKETGYFIDDKKDGVWEHFNEKGIKISEASYSEGMKDGNWSVWNENGVMLYHLVYENGKRKLATQWDDQGNLIAGVQAK